jgi:hypothetical protein
MTTLVTTLTTEFTPATGTFMAQAQGGTATLERKQSATADFVMVGDIRNQGVLVDNPVAGVIYRFTSTLSTVKVQADQ